MIIFVLWTTLFATQYLILKSNKTDVEGYDGIPTLLGYFLLAFENGIGNIQNPTVDVWISEFDQTFSASIIIFLIYFFWFLNQFVSLIVLLNFVIALISQVFEQVMDSRMMYDYIQR
jgi:hypothetical protein